MDRNRFSAIAHRHHLYSNPVSPAKLEAVVRMADPQPDQQVIDIGAGNCELLIRLVETHGVAATAVEIYEGAVAEGRRRMQGRIDGERVAFVVEDAAKAVWRFGADQFDLGICIGSTHALGGLEPTLRELQRCVKPGGHLLVGEGYWKQKPSPEYLAALGGAEESELRRHWENVAAGEALGLTPLWSYTASDDDWDEYEWLYSSTVERFCAEHPDDPDCEAMLERIRAWRSTYLRWGRDTLGFALYLFRVN